jgi:hypothetical protein
MHLVDRLLATVYLRSIDVDDHLGAAPLPASSPVTH